MEVKNILIDDEEYEVAIKVDKEFYEINRNDVDLEDTIQLDNLNNKLVDLNE